MAYVCLNRCPSAGPRWCWRDATAAATAGALRQQLLSPGLCTGTSVSPAVSGVYRLEQRKRIVFDEWREPLGLVTVQSAPGLYTYTALHTLVDLRIIEVSNAHVHLVGSTEELPYCRLWVGCQPYPEMTRDLSAVEQMGR